MGVAQQVQHPCGCLCVCTGVHTLVMVVMTVEVVMCMGGGVLGGLHGFCPNFGNRYPVSMVASR